MDTADIQKQQPIIVLEGLEGNQPTQLKGLQVPLAPHVDAFVLVWWTIFFLTLFVVIIRTYVLTYVRTPEEK